MRDSLPAVSVVIPSWNGAAFVEKALANLILLEGIEYEVLVVDHGRLNHDTEHAVAAFSDSRIRYIGLDQQLGYAGSVNHGVDNARHSLVAVICNDTLVARDWLKELVLEHGRGRPGAIVVSRVSRPGFPEPLKARMNLWGRIVRPTQVPWPNLLVHPDGAAFLFDKQVYGLPFDSEYFLYQEDVYLGFRAWLAGEEVRLTPNSRAENFDGGTTKRTPYRTAFLTERNRWLNIFSFFSGATLWRILPLLWLDGCFKLIGGTNQIAKLHAWAWLWFHPFTVLGKRR